MQMTPEPLPSRDVPYDPDMTVQEALDAGLVAIIDSGRMTSESRLCGERHPTDSRHCDRSHGHKGRHAVVLRWWNDKKDFVEWAGPDPDAMADAVERFDKHMKELGRFDKHMKELGQQARQVQQVVDRAGVEAMTYGGLRASRTMQFRDKHTGKIRGPK